MGEAFEEDTKLFYEELIKLGNEEGGVFDVPYPEVLAALWGGREVIAFHRMARKVYADNQIDEEKFYRNLKFNENLINSQLGIKEGRVELFKMGEDYLKTMKEALSRKDDNND